MPAGGSWRLDETYVRIKGRWKYLYRAVDKAGDAVDFLLTAKRDRRAALRLLRKAIGHHGAPEKITIDKSGANAAAIESYNTEHEADIEQATQPSLRVSRGSRPEPRVRPARFGS
jgi:transposase-like protein